jgi:hypothetical protein
MNANNWVPKLSEMVCVLVSSNGVGGKEKLLVVVVEVLVQSLWPEMFGALGVLTPEETRPRKLT